jgi:hypothetical protein
LILDACARRRGNAGVWNVSLFEIDVDRVTSHRLAARIGLLALAWTVPAGLHTAMEMIMQHRVGRTIDPVLLFVTTTAPWYIWVVATPVVLSAVRRWPVLRPLRPAPVVSHLALWIGITVLYVGVRLASRWAMGLPAPRAPLVEQIVGWLPFALLAYAAVAGMAHAALYARRAREQAIERALLAEQLARAQLDALRAQLHPHFLFNALNTIAMLVREHRVDTAVRLIAELGALLRDLLRGATAAEVPLRQELDLVGRYLMIEQARFGDRLRVDQRVPGHLLDAPVPPLVLQPLVENALRHGVARSTGPGLLCIDVTQREQVLVLTVRDNGPMWGSEPTAADGLGMGLVNTRERLRCLYGNGAYLCLAHDGEGTVATIVLPLRSPSMAGREAPVAETAARVAPLAPLRAVALEASGD